ncbi:MAG TPA: UDP-2,3-diacylglucosamine diphosphatase [Saprospiraceae bacterium]|nr:UDP-2,3-diacylglucosamine diphosphatase [Saprospiraceae bacterium]
MNRRLLDLVILSDIHLGSSACFAIELMEYLKSIKPEKLIINGDFCDFREEKFKKIPTEHKRILEEIENMSSTGTLVYFIQGNYDKGLNKLSEKKNDNLQVRSQIELIIQNKRYLVIHGDKFNSTIINSSLIFIIGTKTYSVLVALSKAINIKRLINNKSYISFASKIRLKINKAGKYMHDFEQASAAYASKEHFDGIICGHTHVPSIQHINNGSESIHYLNSGDWIENMSALEFNNESWTIYRYMDEFLEFSLPKLEVKRRFKKASIIG